MKIGIIADTHVPHGSVCELTPKILETFAGVDQILHCGDIFSLSVLDWLETSSPVAAVWGFGDATTGDDRIEGPTRVLTIGGISIGMIHYLNWPGESILKTDGTLELPSEPLSEVLARKFNSPVDVVVFGDSHQEYISSHEGILFVNPGSTSYPRLKQPAGDIGTVAILSVDRGKASAEIVRLRR